MHPEKTENERNEFQQIVKRMITLVGEDANREGLLKTPKRVAESFSFLTSGYKQKPEEVIGDAIFQSEGDDMVVSKDIEFYSLCEHHLLPFYGYCHIAYLPKDKIIGLSKISRIVNVFARRFQIQERLTRQIASAIQEILEPRGVGVVIQAKHLCMMMRGVEKQEPNTLTSCMLGTFKSDPRTRTEFLDLIRTNL